MLGSRIQSLNLPKIIRNPAIIQLLQKRNGSHSYSEKDLQKIEFNISQSNAYIYKKLNRAEFNKFVGLTLGRKLDDVDLHEMFVTMDDNKDGYIGRGEILTHLEKGLHEQTGSNLAYAFCRFDKDLDDYMFLHELREALFYLGFFHAGDDKLVEIFECRDQDSDNRITFKEFEAIVKEDMPKLN